MREQAPGANLLHDSVSWASSLVCTEICFAGACLRSKLPRVYRNLLCGSVFQEQAPSCVLVGVLTRERVSGASSLVCTRLLELAYELFYSFTRFESDPSSSASEEGSNAEDKPKHKEKEKKKKSPEKKRKAASSKSASPKKKAKISVCTHTFCNSWIWIHLFLTKPLSKTLPLSKRQLVKRKQKQHLTRVRC